MEAGMLFVSEWPYYSEEGSPSSRMQPLKGTSATNVKADHIFSPAQIY